MFKRSLLVAATATTYTFKANHTDFYGRGILSFDGPSRSAGRSCASLE